ncbi:MAG: acetyltransferase [Christensenellaceae bacterium]|jgi:predicted deacetylase|nr:acetyltransferase [Christensenellaceae bacterium]
MVFAGNGLTYADLKAMDIAEYREAVEARLLWQEEWRPKKGK